mmetsp:Transcript_10513/g.20411  ORF Transcript_10513/g.20411 Transcript_10513/m.20411 type:complete len:105 (-) Transcript_10513:711-1025(-)
MHKNTKNQNTHLHRTNRQSREEERPPPQAGKEARTDVTIEGKRDCEREKAARQTKRHKKRGRLNFIPRSKKEKKSSFKSGRTDSLPPSRQSCLSTTCSMMQAPC